ncbi:Intraflagellar transport protein 140 [Spironucleus salmonicida]|uniref:Intraflagellar transport protein 140 n=1 Tax=Spironucleus salmonicida TaxID=348837 RepID=V6LQJ6_9EUKA|nr:Intraflagellar transport protein 140 [Spironucleus salmonicida]|eukprot:EST46855.1 Intraflagellar transport protein 140 [Spironucleus salmonicida]
MYADIKSFQVEASDRIQHLMLDAKKTTAYVLLQDGSFSAFRSSTVRPTFTRDSPSLQLKASLIASHPFLDICAISTLTGEVHIFNSETNELTQLPPLHQSELSILQFIAYGRILITGDVSGRLIVSQFDPKTLTLTPVAKIQRSGRPIFAFERTACTQNFYLNFAQEEQIGDKIASQIGQGPLEIIVGYDKGDLLVIQDAAKHQIIANLPQGIFKVFYWGENDTGAAISPAGDLVIFGFETVGWRSKKLIFGRSKLEFSQKNDIVQVGNCKLAYVSTTGAQIKIIDVFNQNAQIIEIDDFLSDFTGVNGTISYIHGVGVIVPVKSVNYLVIIDLEQSKVVKSRFNSECFNNNFLSVLDGNIADITKTTATSSQNYTVVDTIELSFKNAFSKANSDSILLSDREFAFPSDGTLQVFQILSFKRPKTSSSTQINAVLLQQTLQNESPINKHFLENQFQRARNTILSAFQTNYNTVKIIFEGVESLIQTEFEIENIATILSASDKQGYVVVQGGRNIATFEVQNTQTSQIESFKTEHEVTAIALFGRHIIASLTVREEGKAARFELQKLTISGTVSQTLSLGCKILKIQVVNFHLFLCAQQVLFYAEMKGFSQVLEICKIAKDYLFSTENDQVMLINELPGPMINIKDSLKNSFNIQTVQISGFTAISSLENINFVNLAFSFTCFNDILCQNIEIPTVFTLQVDISDIQQIINSKEITSSNFVKSARVLDFTPHVVREAKFDCFENLCVETELTDLNIFLLIGFSASISKRFCVFHRNVLLYENCTILRQIVESTREFAEEEEHQDIQLANGLSMVQFLQFLSIKVSKTERERILTANCDNYVDKNIIMIQGVFAPFLIPKIENHEISCQLLSFISPIIGVICRENRRKQLVQKVLSLTSLTPSEPFNQSPKTTFTLTKFIISVQNNRFSDAYNFVAQFDSPEIWRSLASLCVKNNYFDLLKTCISHLKQPMVSLILRSNSIASDNKNQEISSLLSIILNDLNTGMQIVQSKPILSSKIMNQVGLGTFQLEAKTSGFSSITRKSTIYNQANRLFQLGDNVGSNACYSEIFQGENIYISDVIQQQNQVQNLNAKEQIMQEFESNGLTQAVQLAKRLNSKSSLFTAANLLEKAAYDQNNVNWIQEAAKLYNLAGCQTHALQCGIACQNDDVIYNIGSTTKNQRISLQAAAYFAKKAGEGDCLERALVLYSCSGFTGQAVELCLQTGKIKELSGLLNDSLNNNGKISQELLIKSGTMLIQLDQSQFALDDYNSFLTTGILALAHAKATDQALHFIASDKLKINAKLADLLTPEDAKTAENQQIVITIGKLLFKAELYQEAVQKFILANDSYLALNALIKLGNVEKVVKFAQMSRNKNCFIAAGNFLQTQNFRDNLQFMTWIIQFYQKANAIEFLIKFFMNCATEEIDVFNDYEKAMDALREAAKWIGKFIVQLQENNESNEKLERLRNDKKLVEQNGRLIMGFLNLIDFARNNLNNVDASETLTQNAKKLTQAIVAQDNCMVQVPHVLAFMCEFHAQRGESSRVLQIMKNMQSQGFSVEKYVDEGVVSQYGSELGIEVKKKADLQDVEVEQGVQEEVQQSPVNDDIGDVDIEIEL